MKKGFSLTEVVSVVVILGVLAAIAIPNFTKTQDKNNARQAVTYLRTIRLAEKMHFSKNGSHSTAVVLPTGCTAMTPLNSASDINKCLGTEVQDGAYTYSVTASGATFTARARKGSTASVDCTETNTICVNQDGAWSGTSTYKPTI